MILLAFVTAILYIKQHHSCVETKIDQLEKDPLVHNWNCWCKLNTEHYYASCSQLAVLEFIFTDVQMTSVYV